MCYYNTGEGQYPNGPVEVSAPEFPFCIIYKFNGQTLYAPGQEGLFEYLTDEVELLLVCFTYGCNKPKLVDPSNPSFEPISTEVISSNDIPVTTTSFILPSESPQYIPPGSLDSCYVGEGDQITKTNVGQGSLFCAILKNLTYTYFYDTIFIESGNINTDVVYLCNTPNCNVPAFSEELSPLNPDGTLCYSNDNGQADVSYMNSRIESKNICLIYQSGDDLIFGAFTEEEVGSLPNSVTVYVACKDDGCNAPPAIMID